MRLATGLAVTALVCSSVFAAETGQRTLTFEDRVAAQKAIEQVYWKHRDWPKANPDPKPEFSVAMPDDKIQGRVDAYLRESNALDLIWKRPITAQQLQAELDRMAEHTRDAALLREIFEALGNDPFVIAETLARQTLADRQLRNWYAFDDGFQGGLRAKAETALAACHDASCMASMGGDYRETVWSLRTGDAATSSLQSGEVGVPLDAEAWTALLKKMTGLLGGTPDSLPLGTLSGVRNNQDGFEITAVLSQSKGQVTTANVVWRKTAFESWWASLSGSVDSCIEATSALYTLPVVPRNACVTDVWTPTFSDSPDAGYIPTAVWTGTEMIVWGNGNPVSRYNPATDTWSRLTLPENVPTIVYAHTAVWTGTEMIVWGGISGVCGVNAGGRYNPTSDTWVSTSTGVNVPAGRAYHSAVWTGTRMIVWGGIGCAGGNTSFFNSGGIYDPATDTWSSTSVDSGVPEPRFTGTAVWTGSEMVVWGGQTATALLNSGGRYNPLTNTWVPTSNGINVPSARGGHAAVWTGTEMIVWGGYGSAGDVNTGGRYSPTTDSWTPTSTPNAPQARDSHTAIWTGTKMIVWGGWGPADALDTGALYDPASDSWTHTSTGMNSPTARAFHTAVWTGTEMIVWGGGDSSTSAFNTGGRYDPATNAWMPTSTGSVPAPSEQTAIWTGTEMIVWGGSEDGTGGRYSPALDRWAPIALENAPSVRLWHTAVWTGTQMVVWGGVVAGGGPPLNDGGMYDPAADSWVPGGTGVAPISGRSQHTAVWTGTEMIVWGGGYGDGSRYDPVTRIWRGVTSANAPAARMLNTAVWTGSEMIIWGGWDNTGGRYNPVSNAWTRTSTASGVPEGRQLHTAVWTGTGMIVWGGWDGHELNSGGIYNPVTDTWLATSTGSNVPDPREYHVAVWTGTEMIVWGGFRNSGPVNTGGRYDPVTNSWTPTSTGPGVPTAGGPTAIWTGTQMIVWGPSTIGGAYTPYAAVVCDDGNPCTDDSCNPITGCVFTNNTGSCDDGNACTTNDTCGGGTCHSGSPINCDDGNPCTDDSCDPIQGCIHTNNTNPCDDGNACTMGDTCGGGVCNPGTRGACDDNNPCTTDTCTMVTTWIPQHPANSPPARDRAAMAYDSSTRRLVLFGGSNSNNPWLGDTWTWDDTTWTQQFPASHPPARIFPSLAYDSGRGKLVLFGGSGSGSSLLRDTWTWDGTTWTQQFPAVSPSARFEASMAYDSGTGQLVLFGGLVGGNTALGDTWTWDGTTWTHKSPVTSPPARFGASMAYDSGTGQLVLFGGNGRGDTWTWDGTNWTQKFPANNPPARIWAAMAYDTATKQLVLFSGYPSAGAIVPDTWTWDGTNWTQQLPGSSPSARWNAAVAYDSSSGQLVLFGGNYFGFLGDTWTYGYAPTVTCANTPTPGATCNDGNACTANDTCTSDGTCVGAIAVACNDDNPCTDDSCNPATGCVFTNNTAACDDANACTVGDTCGGGTCNPGMPLDCDDGNACTNDSCNPTTGCVHTFNTAPCNDGNACTHNDVCGNGACAGIPYACAAPDQCHQPGACNGDGTCSFTNKADGTACNDGNACTADDTCTGGVCHGGTQVVCTDNNPCTTDTCNPTTGCVFTNNTNACDDGNACTTGDTCGGGTCQGGPPPNCNDGNACNGVETCNPATGCVPGTPLVCDDGNVCNGVETCNPATGCVAGTPLHCDDGNACNGVETCNPATGCVAGTPVVCTPLDQCHDLGVCAPVTGLCSNPNKANGVACDDGNPYTYPDTCQSGICVGGASCQITPQPKSAGYYKSLCKNGQSHPGFGDALTDADAVCVGTVTRTFAGFSTVADICNVIGDPEHHSPPDGDDAYGKECEKSEDELLALALNICRNRVCTNQEVDSDCTPGPQDVRTTVSASLATADGIQTDSNRNKDTCKLGRCLAKEVNDGHGVHHTSLTLSRLPNNGVRMTWAQPTMDDGTGVASSYTLWRRVMNSGDAYTQIGTTNQLTFDDTAVGNWEYEVTFTLLP